MRTQETVMQHRSNANGIRLAVVDHVNDMIEVAGSTCCDDRNRYSAGDGSREFQIKTFASSFTIDGGEQDFTSPEVHDSLRPLDGVKPRTLAAVVRVRLVVAVGLADRLDRNHNRGRPEALRRFLNK